MSSAKNDGVPLKAGKKKSARAAVKIPDAVYEPNYSGCKRNW
ncbi:hypothetical protein O977_02520 [Mycobacterium avium subsp. paratuberculosis 10-5975]|nr:hypothetical protein O977_02520 [Mycobacterium avium subsp. paratuberculosis 10-5975]